MTSKYYVTDELYHHGILGQKWGVRRYQNPDGSLTAEGEKRYNKLSKKIAKQERNIAKWQKKVDNKSGTYLRAEKKKAKAYKLKNKALNGLFISDSKRAKLNIKADRLLAKANKMQNNTIKNEAKIRKAQALINKYDRKMSKINPNHVNKGKSYVDAYLNRR